MTGHKNSHEIYFKDSVQCFQEFLRDTIVPCTVTFPRVDVWSSLDKLTYTKCDSVSVVVVHCVG